MRSPPLRRKTTCEKHDLVQSGKSSLTSWPDVKLIPQTNFDFLYTNAERIHLCCLCDLGNRLGIKVNGSLVGDCSGCLSKIKAAIRTSKSCLAGIDWSIPHRHPALSNRPTASPSPNMTTHSRVPQHQSDQ